MDDIGFVSQSKARRSEAPHRKLNAGDLSLVMSCVILCHCQPQLFGASNANHSLPFFSSGIPSGTAAVTLKMWGELWRVVTFHQEQKKVSASRSCRDSDVGKTWLKDIESWKRVEAHERRSKWNREIICGFCMFLYVFVILIPFAFLYQHFGINPVRIMKAPFQEWIDAQFLSFECLWASEETDAALRRAKKETCAGRSSILVSNSYPIAIPSSKICKMAGSIWFNADIAIYRDSKWVLISFL
jgi:hypothetical protein